MGRKAFKRRSHPSEVHPYSAGGYGRGGDRVKSRHDLWTESERLWGHKAEDCLFMRTCGP